MESAPKRSLTNEGQKALFGKTLLCIDDHPDTLLMMRLLLESHGAELVTAECIDEAMGFLRKSTIDLVVCDMIMPDGGAMAILEKLRKASCFIPVIALTGLSEHQCLRGTGRFAAYLTKPVDESILVGTILDVFDAADLVRRIA
jgi:CheY-like chemotaxis protein